MSIYCTALCCGSIGEVSFVNRCQVNALKAHPQHADGLLFDMYMPYGLCCSNHGLHQCHQSWLRLIPCHRANSCATCLEVQRCQ